MCVCECMPRGDEVPVEPRGVSSPGSGEQAAVSHPRWVLELDLGCSGRSGHLNSCSVSPDPLKNFLNFIVLFYLYVCVMYSM